MLEKWTHEEFENLKPFGFPGFFKVEVVEVEQYCVLVEVERIDNVKPQIEVNATAYGDWHTKMLRL